CFDIDKTFIWTLEIRALYGGMKIDQQMLRYHEELWMKKKGWCRAPTFDEVKCRAKLDPLEEDIEEANNQTEYSISLDDEKSLLFTKDDILLEGFDYHTYPW